MKSLFYRRTWMIAPLTLVLLLVLFVPAPVKAADNPECWALIIGIGEYKDPDINVIQGPVNEAQAMYEVFSEAWGEDNVTLLLNEEATKENIRFAFTALAKKASADDTVLICHSGHGNTDYLVPYDAYETPIKNNYVTDEDLGRWLDDIEAEHIGLIIGSCRSGSLADKLAGEGRVSLLSSKAEEYSWELARDGVFGDFIIEGIENFSATDNNSDCRLSLEELFTYASPKTAYTMSWYNQEQHPVIQDDYQGELAVLERRVFRQLCPTEIKNDEVYLAVNGREYSDKELELLQAPGTASRVVVTENLAGAEGWRYQFTGWDDGKTELERLISGAGEFGVNYSPQVLLTLDSPVGGISEGGWYFVGKTATIKAEDVVGADTRHIFTGWSGDYSGTETEAVLTLDQPMSVEADWRTEHLLLVTSEYDNPIGDGWYVAGDEAAVSVEKSVGFPISHKFTGWSGSLDSTSPEIAVVMNSPVVLTANWRTDYTWVYVLSGGAVVIIAVGLFLGFRLKRKKAAAAMEFGIGASDDQDIGGL